MGLLNIFKGFGGHVEKTLEEQVEDLMAMAVELRAELAPVMPLINMLKDTEGQIRKLVGEIGHTVEIDGLTAKHRSAVEDKPKFDNEALATAMEYDVTLVKFFKGYGGGRGATATLDYTD